MQPILLICTVGGSPDAAVASIVACQAARVIFVCSPDSARSVPGALQTLISHGLEYDSGRVDVVELPNAQELEQCVESIHRQVSPLVGRWLAGDSSRKIVVDFTGGTKCMTLALGLMTRSWPCRLQYVGGTERTKNGLGIVISGKEQIVHFEDPWDSLGYQLLDDVRAIFDSGNYGAAAVIAAETRNRISSGPLKGAVAALTHFLEGYAYWDRFEHRDALRCLERFCEQRNLLAPLVPSDRVESLGRAVEPACRFLREFRDSARPSRMFILDLLANARRRLAEMRFDDSVARSYRAIEAIAQWRLAEGHGISSTGSVPVKDLPESLQIEWGEKATEGLLKIGLQDGYRLLEALGDLVGIRFRKIGLVAAPGAERTIGSPLTARNSSYLAHGFQPAPETVARKLLAAALVLLEAAEADLPAFPTLGSLVQVGRE